MKNTLTIQVQWGDCDPAGIVFYPNYFAWLNASTDALFAQAGLSVGEAMSRYGIIGWPMVDTQARFLSPSRFGDTLRFETHLSAIKRSSFEVTHQVYKADSSLALEARDIRVWAAADSNGHIAGRTVPQEVRTLFGL